MSSWAGYMGPGNPDDMRSLLGGGAVVHIGANFGLGLQRRGAEPARLSVRPDGGASVQVGQEPDCASSATIEPSGPELQLVCDPFGFHRVYTTWVGPVFWFASDLRLLGQICEASSTLDVAALHGYLCFSYVPTPRTIVQGICSLPAGERYVLRPRRSPHRTNTACWAEAPAIAVGMEDAILELRSRLRCAIERRLMGAGRVGVCLSGGLDSSLIAAMLTELGAKPELFTLDFGPPYNVELTHARQVAAHLRRPLHEVPARPANVQGALLPTAGALHQPFGDGVTVPLYLLGQAAAQQVDTVFNGEGGDQLFGGWANKPMVAAEAYGRNGFCRTTTYLQTFHRLHGLTDRFYTAAAQQAVRGLEAGAWVRPALEAPDFSSLLHRLRAANLWLKGAQNIAPRARQLAAAHGLAMHAPFFDRSLAHWTFTLPPEWLLHGACEKYLLKRAAEPYLPADIVWREKRGMGVPTTEWCLGPLRRHVGRWLSRHRLKQAGWFETSTIRELGRGVEVAADFRSRRTGELLWMLLMLHVWLDRHGPQWDWPVPAKWEDTFDEVHPLWA